MTIREYGDAQTRNAAGERAHALYTKEYRLMPPEARDHYARAAFDDLVAFLGGSGPA